MWRMAMGTRQSEQGSLWVATAELPKSPGHPFYTRLNALLDANDFDRFVEGQCARFYAPLMGRPSLAPGRYFRLLLVGFLRGIDSERGIAWRASDSLAVRSFLRLPVDEPPPDHTTISRTRRVGRRQPQLRERARHPDDPVAHQRALVEQRLYDLLDEERVAAGALRDQPL